MPFLFFLFVSTILSQFNSIVPGRLADLRGGGGSVLELNVRVGTPPRDVRFVADFAIDMLIFAESPLEKSFSATITPVGYTDLLHIAGAHIMIPLTVDPSFVMNSCPSCDGVIGMSASSPIWSLWRHIEISASGLRLDAPHLNEGAICTQPDPLFCNTTGTIFGTSVRILFYPSEPVTRLPNALFRKLRGGRSILDKWPDLHIYLDGTGPQSKRMIRIPGDHIVRRVAFEPEVLTVDKQDTAASVVIIGYEALRTVKITRDLNTGFLQTEEMITERNLTVFQALSLLLFWPLFFYWKLVRPIFRLTTGFLAKHGLMVIMHIFFDVLVIISPYLFFWQRGTWQQLLYDPLMFALIGGMSLHSTFWLVLSLINMIIRGSEHFGIFGSDFVKKREPMYVGDQVVRTSRNQEMSLRIARSMIVHQWSRDMNTLFTIWLIFLAVSPGTLRGVSYVLTYIAIFCTSFGSSLTGILYDRRAMSVLWTSWVVLSWIQFSGCTFIFSIRVVAPLAEIIDSYLQVPTWGSICIFYLLMTFAVAQVERGRLRTLNIWTNKKKERKIK